MGVAANNAGKSDKIPLVDIQARIRSVDQPLREAIERVVSSGRFILGPEVQALEAEVAERCRVSHGMGVSSGTDALVVALMALGVGPGDEVITTPFSFFASAGAISRLGARPVFADIEADTFNLDPAKVAEKATAATRAIEVVHLFGQCGDVAPMRRVAENAGAVVIEDAAQAIGASRDNVPAGALGALGCFSFFPTKNLGGLGDGGMVVTDDTELADKVRMLRAHGAKPKYYHHHVGGNFRLDEIQAAALRVMLPRLDGWNVKRRENADRYDTLFRDAGLVDSGRVVLPARVPECFHIFHQYVIRVPEQRDALQSRMIEAGIATGVYYPVCLHLQPCFRDLGYDEGDMPVAEQASREVLALPIYPELTAEQQERVADTVVGFFG